MFDTLEKSIGYTFKDKELLKKALTHTSYAYENKIESNEKLFEFTIKQSEKFVENKAVDRMIEEFENAKTVEKSDLKMKEVK